MPRREDVGVIWMKNVNIFIVTEDELVGVKSVLRRNFSWSIVRHRLLTWDANRSYDHFLGQPIRLKLTGPEANIAVIML